MSEIDECKFAHALAVLDKVDSGTLAAFDGSYAYHCCPWFLETLRIALKITKERYSHD